MDAYVYCRPVQILQRTDVSWVQQCPPPGRHAQYVQQQDVPMLTAVRPGAVLAGLEAAMAVCPQSSVA